MSEDRAALVSLFWSTGGSRWYRKGNWDTGAHLSRWRGVQVSDDGRVVELRLHDSNLRGTIPEAVGALKELKNLDLHNNNLTGPIPEALGGLQELAHLDLGWNELTGSIPAWLGSLKKLRTLGLHSNQLAGRIPEALGALKELTHLWLDDNQITGSIPICLGSLSKLQRLELNGNQLVGHIPKELGNLENLQRLHLQDNHLTGVIPTELGKLSCLWKFEFRSTGSKTLRGGNKLTVKYPAYMRRLFSVSEYLGVVSIESLEPSGGPAEGEGLDSWKYRMRLTEWRMLRVSQKEEDAPAPRSSPPPVLLPQQQETGEGDLKEEDPPVSPYPPRRTWITKYLGTHAPGKKEEDPPVPPTAPLSVLLPQEQQAGEGDEKEEDAPVLLGSPNQRQEAVGDRVRSPGRASSSPEKAEEMDRMFSAQLSSSAGLDSLIREKPEALEDIQRVLKAPAAESFFFDNQFSDMEGRRKLGTLVTMSTALGEVALRHTEDVDIQRKELALVPFSKAYYNAVRTGLCEAYLAASVINSDWVSTSKTSGMGKAGAALKLMSSAVPVVDGLAELAGKALETADNFLQTRRLVKITAMAADAVECCSLARRLALQLADGLRDDTGMMDDEAGRVHTTAGMNGGSGCGRYADMMPGDMREEDVFEYLLEEVASYERNDHGGKRLGKKHLRKLLKAIQRGCLDGSNGTVQKIKVLLLEILPEADDRPAATSSTPKEVIVRSPPVVAAAHDSGLPSRAEFSAMQAELAALKSAKDKQQAELEALASAKETLERKVKKLEKHVPELDSDPDDEVDFAGQLALRRRVAVTETAEGFLDRARDRAARAGDHHPVTVSEQREFKAVQNEKHRELEARLRELEGEISKATKRKGRR